MVIMTIKLYIIIYTTIMTLFRRLAMLVPMSRPKAPVSSDVSQNCIGLPRNFLQWLDFGHWYICRCMTSVCMTPGAPGVLGREPDLSRTLGGRLYCII